MPMSLVAVIPAPRPASRPDDRDGRAPYPDEDSLPCGQQTCHRGVKPSMPPMLRRLQDAALPFIQATDVDQVLETLVVVASEIGFGLYGMVARDLVERDEDVGVKTIFGSSVPPSFRADIVSEYKRHAGPTVIRHYSRQHPPPFTLTEVMRRLQPSGEDRWIFDVLRDHGVRDGLHCTHSPWGVLYSSDHVLKGAELSDEIRMALNVTSGMAINRIKEIAAGSSPAPLAELSPRELSVLLHLSDGFSVSEIADRLFLSETSVKTFVRRATKKLNASSQLHAVALAVRSRLI
jgi:DNA-binding CsgD family transcriptional regulator